MYLLKIRIMASLFGHGVLGYTLAKVIDEKQLKILVFLAISSAILPDIDVITFKLNIPYENWLGHRGFTHSIFFAVLWGILCAFIWGKDRKVVFFIIIFLATISHGILDAMTTGGLGVGFLIPFENTRYFLSFRPIQVSPIGVANFFSKWGLKVVLSEMIWIGIPVFVILIINRFKNNND